MPIFNDIYYPIFYAWVVVFVDKTKEISFLCFSFFKFLNRNFLSFVLASFFLSRTRVLNKKKSIIANEYTFNQKSNDFELSNYFSPVRLYLYILNSRICGTLSNDTWQIIKLCSKFCVIWVMLSRTILKQCA